MFLFNLIILVFSFFTVFIPFVREDEILSRLFLNFLGQIGTASFIILAILPFFKLNQSYKEPIVERKFFLTFLLLCIGYTLVIANSFLLEYMWNVFQVKPKSSYEGITLQARHLGEPFSILLYLLTLTLGAATFEEYVFRRTLIPSLETRGFSPIAAVFASSLIFSLSHLPNDLLNGNIPFTIEHLMSTFLLGLILGIAFIQTRHVIYPIFLHMFYNGYSGVSTIAQLLSQLQGYTTLLNITTLLLIALILIGLVAILYSAWKLLSEAEPAWLATFKTPSQGKILWGSLLFLVIFLTFMSIQEGLPTIILTYIANPLLIFPFFIGLFLFLTGITFYLAKKLQTA